MVKSKKMSKTSIAVIVLAILLVLALCLGITGAWFTDIDSGNASRDLNFGKIEVQVNDANGEAEGDPAVTFTAATGSGENDKFLPGDTWDIAGSITNLSNVDSYVLVTYSVYLKNGANMYKVYTTADGNTEAITVALAPVTTDTKWAAQGASQNILAYGSEAAEGKAVLGLNEALFLVDDVDHGTGSDTLGMAGTVVVRGNETKNVVYFQQINADGTVHQTVADTDDERFAVLLNGNELYDVVVAVDVKAIQAEHFTAVSAYEKLTEANYPVDRSLGE